MAVDSEEKRKSVPRWIAGIPGFGGPGIIPDGTIDAGDRQTISNVYSGIAAGGAPGIGAVPNRKKGLLLGVY